jgi:hypothetical protein
LHLRIVHARLDVLQRIRCVIHRALGSVHGASGFATHLFCGVGLEMILAQDGSGKRGIGGAVPSAGAPQFGV